MIIFASDLDGTLIFSEKHCSGISPETPLEGVDFYKEKQFGYITKTAFKGLMEINEKALFIPVTTRTYDQYSRMSFFYNTLSPKYAVVANGGILLKEGTIDKDWEHIIKLKMKEHIPLEDIRLKCSFFLEKDFVKSFNLCQELFWAIVIDENTFDKECFSFLAGFTKAHGYAVSRQGRKVYIIPESINKWSPLQYIAEKEGQSMIIAAGDSSLDYPMLKNASCAIMPDHGEIKALIRRGCLSYDGMYITENSGILAGEEIVNKVLKKIEEDRR